MGLFSKKTKEEEVREAFEKFGLNIIAYDEDKIKEENIKNLKQIAQDVILNNWFKTGMALSFASLDKQAAVGYLSAVFNQNWIIIRQNELMIRLLEKLTKRGKV